jgi:hypothetical protein
MPADPHSLAQLQFLLYRLFTAPNGIDEGLSRENHLDTAGLEQIILGDERLSARERLEIYANAYFYRLLGVLREDFPRTTAILGEADFHNLITGYLIDYPPSQPSLFEAGRYLADYLAAHPLLERFPFLADLARLERANLEVFHGPDAPALAAETLRELTPEQWPGIGLRLHPAARILDLRWRVDRLLDDPGCTDPPEHREVTLLLWRREWNVRRRELNHGERAALRAAESGTEFSALCAAIETELAAAPADERPVDLPGLINRMLARWLSEGVFAALQA